MLGILIDVTRMILFGAICRQTPLKIGFHCRESSHLSLNAFKWRVQFVAVQGCDRVTLSVDFSLQVVRL
jgi:hypothetical protein